MTNAEYEAELARIAAAVTDPSGSVGASVGLGNLAVAPAMVLEPVYADAHGRLWRRNAVGTIVCIVDLREIQDSTGTVGDPSRFG